MQADQPASFEGRLRQHSVIGKSADAKEAKSPLQVLQTSGIKEFCWFAWHGARLLTLSRRAQTSRQTLWTNHRESGALKLLGIHDWLLYESTALFKITQFICSFVNWASSCSAGGTSFPFFFSFFLSLDCQSWFPQDQRRLSKTIRLIPGCCIRTQAFLMGEMEAKCRKKTVLVLN